MNEKLFQEIVNHQIKFNCVSFSKRVIYEMGAEDDNRTADQIKCNKKKTLDMELHISHGTF